MTTQCSTCIHWERRGGVVFKATMTCTEANGDTFRVAVLTDLATRERCPFHFKATTEDMPDAYRALDLPLSDFQ